MTSNKPYLIRALYEWLVDNGATPYLLVDSSHPQLEIPPGIEKDGRVVLNIAARAVQRLVMENSHIAFSARFNGRAHELFIPIQAVRAIYSMEDGEGMMFAEDEPNEDANPQQKGAKPSGPGLKVVK